MTSSEKKRKIITTERIELIAKQMEDKYNG